VARKAGDLRWGVVSLLLLLLFLLLFLFSLDLPLRVEQLLIGIEEGVGFHVCILQDGAAGFIIRFLVAGGIGVEAIEGYIFVQKDHPELDNLVFIEVKFILKDRQLAGSPLKR
jgi:hypothetical protein